VSYIEELLAEPVRQEREKRQREIAARWGFYDGEHDKPLKVTPGKGGRPSIDDNVTPNLAGMFVDRGVTFLVGEPPAFTLDLDAGVAGGESDAETEGNVKVAPEEQHLDAIWKFNRRKTLLHKWATNGGVTGHAWFRIVVPEHPIEHPLTGLILPRIVNVDPSTVDVLYDQDDIERELAFLLEWNIYSGGRPAVRRQTIELDDSESSWTIRDYISKGDARTFEPFGEGEVAWPWPFPPLIGAQNLPRPNEYHGASDLEGGLEELNGSVSRVLSNLARIVRFHAHPKTWASGISTAELASVVVDPDGVIGLPHPDAQLHNLEMTSDLSGALSVFSKLKGLLHELARMPELDSEKLEGVGQMSGLALKILYGPALELTNTKRGTYGDALEELNRRILAVSHAMEYDPTLEVAIGWKDALPTDEVQELAAAEAKQRLGVSKHTLIEELGYDPEQEAERRQDEADASMENMARTFDKGGFDPSGSSSSSDDSDPAAGGGQE
jgi:hypothetical protein